jgi:hypothetical protein
VTYRQRLFSKALLIAMVAGPVAVHSQPALGRNESDLLQIGLPGGPRVSRRAVLFAVADGGMERVVILDPDRYVKAEGFDTRLYYKPGRSYRLLFGGGEVGTVKGQERGQVYQHSDGQS